MRYLRNNTRTTARSGKSMSRLVLSSQQTSPYSFLFFSHSLDGYVVCSAFPAQLNTQQGVRSATACDSAVEISTQRKKEVKLNSL